MERQKKPWEEMTEEEQQAVRESWKFELPEEYDVFCIGDMIREECEVDLNIPGNFYVSGVLNVFNLIVKGTAIIDDSIDAGNITVQGGSCICGEDIVANDVFVSNGDFISDGDIDTGEITVRNGDCIIRHSINSFTINVDGSLDCYDVDSNGREVHAADYICQYYYEEI